ncbi:hypothetical protein PIB30_026234 [Stylosanthes scabra]|uniref:Uncharacterized protein n=1 Tax=Stylosanthes scabra TaxID=79078 RepID=A0ABU6QA00_9FABA|nr:hypothetical protein [Stylosanthes scabra]
MKTAASAAAGMGGGGVRFDGPVPVSGEVEENAVVFEHCVTQTLPPALTLEEGLRKIKDAVQMLKLSPPRSSTGFLRFQVAVPPSPKALSWFCSQPELLGVYPLMYLSKNVDNPTLKSLYVNGSRGVFGIGSAVSFSSSSRGKPSLIKRLVQPAGLSKDWLLGDGVMFERLYISSDSTHIVAYGFMDINFDSDSISMNIEDGSFYFFIPEIELDELESISILTVTLAWDEFSLSTFEEALHSLENSLNQIICYTWSGSDTLKLKSVRSGLRKLNLVEDRAIARVYMNTITPRGRESVVDILELKESPSSSQFCVRLSATHAFSNNMLDQSNELSSSLIECANINAVWATLIVEECSRLGLTVR